MKNYDEKEDPIVQDSLTAVTGFVESIEEENNQTTAAYEEPDFSNNLEITKDVSEQSSWNSENEEDEKTAR